MIGSRTSSLCIPAAMVALALASCGRGSEPPGEAEGATATTGETHFRYIREFIFVAQRHESPVVVPFTFRATDDGERLHRSAIAWLARGSTWDRFLEEANTTSRAGGVWRIIPQGDLRVIAGGPTEIETLRFERGERRLRLDLDAPITGWNEGGETRFRLLSGRIAIGPETMAGTIFEVLRVERTLDDDWAPDSDLDAMYLVGGDSLQFVLADAAAPEDVGAGYGWLRIGSVERTLPGIDIRWLEVRPLQDARRDIPRRWSFQVPGSAIHGELEATGFDPLLGPERAGRRSVEIRFNVEGWIVLAEERLLVAGMIHHTQQ